MKPLAIVVSAASGLLICGVALLRILIVMYLKAAAGGEVAQQFALTLIAQRENEIATGIATAKQIETETGTE
jgi:hypothetical protein